MKKLIACLMLSCPALVVMLAQAAGNDTAYKSVAVLPTVKQPVELSFQAVSWRNDSLIASGTQGGIFISSDNGRSWRQLAAPANTRELQFRDNQLLTNERLVVMSAGEGADSGIFISDDYGLNWRRVATGDKPTTFYDCFYMQDDQQGWLYGDSDEQGLFILHTSDGAKSWQRLTLTVSAQPNEGGFASSGSCVSPLSNGQGVAIGTGNGAKARLLLHNNGQWEAIGSPIAGGEATGIFSVQSSDDFIYVSGGSLKHSEKAAEVWRYSLSDQRWHALPELPMKGAVYGSALLNEQSGLSVWVSNPQGVWYLASGATRWQQVSESNIWSLACQPGIGCVGVGKSGTIERYMLAE